MLSKLNLPSRRLVRSTVAFRGLDRSAQAGEGDFTDQRGLSPDRWPQLSPAQQDRVEELAGAESLFVWNGHQVLARDGCLWYDGSPLCNLTAGSKQFAVVNSALVVWPDGLAVDLEEQTVSQLSARATNRGEASFTTKSLTLAPRTVYSNTTLRYRSGDERVPWLWVYDQVSWTAEEGWVCEGGQWLRADRSQGKYCIPGVTYSQQSGSWSTQMPDAQFRTSAPTQPGQPDNEEGFCLLIVQVPEAEQTASSFSCTIDAQVFWLAQNAVALDSLFRVGDAVDITGSLYGLMDVERAIVRAIDPETNTLTFDPSTFRTGDAVGVLGSGVENDDLGIRYEQNGQVYRYRARHVTAQAGQYVVLDQAGFQAWLLDQDKKTLAQYELDSVTTLSGYTTVSMQSLNRTRLELEVVRPVPDLAFICHHDNRLWGVSNTDNCVYASALGDPAGFYRYDGLSTDSYTVAVGSQGPFTGICSHNGSVLCWKEQGLHKVLGTQPANYQLASYTLCGVGRGNSKSLVSLDGALYYLGRDGVYRYTGSFPRCISQSLGSEPYANGVGGTDGKCYYLSAKRGDGSWELLVFHPDTGLWWGRDRLAVREFARGEEGLLALTEDQLRTLNAGPGYMDFEALLSPMTEALEQVQYSALDLRVQLADGAELYIDFRRDGGDWQQAGHLRDQGGRVSRLRLPLGRCGSLEVRFRGHGDCRVLELSREYRRRGRG